MLGTWDETELGRAVVDRQRNMLSDENGSAVGKGL